MEIIEVSLRDGLQNEAVMVSTTDKIAIADRLADAGARRIEAVSFVHPKAVPQMADAEAVMAGINRRKGVSYAGLVLNARGLDRALAARVDEANVVVCASETFSLRNQNMSLPESTATAVSVIEKARAAGLFTTLTVATAFGCPFEGTVDPEAVMKIVAEGITAGADEVCLADTIGVGVPAQVAALAARVRPLLGDVPLRFHFHDTRNTGLANAWAAVEAGAAALDSSVAGIGGCPFAPAATGNIATEDLIYLLDRSNVAHGIDLAASVDVGRSLCALLGRESESSLSRAGGFPGL